MTIIGPAVGYVTGGQLLMLYTDFLTVDPLTYVRLTTHYSHPVYMLIFIELLAYPRLPYYRINVTVQCACTNEKGHHFSYKV